jgi:P27 family predicted phage terminase small subunit
MRGRPKKPTEIKKLEGNNDKRWLVENEMKVLPMDELPEAPKTFNAATVKIWDTVCRELKRNGLLASCDLELLHGYCILLNQFVDANNMVKKEGLVTVSRHGEQVVNPWYRVQCESLKQATQIGQLFGVTPSARSRINVATTKPQSKLDTLKKPKTA